jgi:hypothetical protein
MTTTTTIPSHERPEPGSHNIPLGKLPSTNTKTPTDPTTIAERITTALNTALNPNNTTTPTTALQTLFLENSYWRDHLVLSWDFRTIHGSQKITEYADKAKAGLTFEIDTSSPLKAPHTGPIDAFGEVHGIEYFIKVSSANGAGHGVIRLAEEEGSGEWKIFTIFTSLIEISGKGEAKGRSEGVKHGELKGRKNWADRRVEESEYLSSDPAVLVVGMFLPSPATTTSSSSYSRNSGQMQCSADTDTIQEPVKPV